VPSIAIGAIHRPQNAELLHCGIGRNEQTVGGTNCEFVNQSLNRNRHP
jgi:hypothetical protein